MNAAGVVGRISSGYIADRVSLLVVTPLSLWRTLFPLGHCELTNENASLLFFYLIANNLNALPTPLHPSPARTRTRFSKWAT